MLLDSSGWMISAAPYAFVALGLLASFLLFASAKRDLQQHDRKHRQSFEQIMTRLEEASREKDAAAPEVIYLPAVRSSFNVHRRAQAMRLLRRGEDVSHIAAVLNVPRKEVELLVRVQRMHVGSGSTAKPISQQRLG